MSEETKATGAPPATPEPVKDLPPGASMQPVGASPEGAQPTMRLRFMTSATLKGATHTAGSVAVVEVSDEAWRLVDTGAANLEPGPGVGGQPHPPEFVTQAEQPLPPTADELADLRREQRERQRAKGMPPAGPTAAGPGVPAPSPAPGGAGEPPAHGPAGAAKKKG